MLLRALTAVALIGGFLAALFLLDAALFAGLSGLLVTAGAYEWARLCRLRPGIVRLYAGACLLLYAALAIGLHPLSERDLPEQMLFAMAALFWLVAVPALLHRGLAGLPQPVLMASGLLVLLPAGLAMAALPPALLLAALVLVWVSDTAAYLGGRSFGRRKLAPAISPGKTWEGLWSALVAVLIYAIICIRLLPDSGGLLAAGWAAYLAAAVALSLTGVLGDLFESALKRQAGVKDSGSVLPGHGGVLDRIDSATAVLPVAAFLLQWIRLG